MNNNSNTPVAVFGPVSLFGGYMKTIKWLYLAPLVIVLMAGCASPTIVPDVSSLSASVLLRAEPLTGLTNVPDLEDVDVLLLNQDMLDFLDENVDRESGQMMRLRALLYALISEGSFGLQYDESTHTAQATFDARQGNCLSFTNMFVAMAREVGIDATYQEIEIPPDWSLHGDTYQLSRHVNVFIDLGSVGVREVDFNIDDFQSSYDRHPISDERALAHFYSNKGAEYMQENDVLEALRHFRKALEIDPEFSPAWSNLGVLYSQKGHYEHAKAAYIQALKINPRELVAMSNLGQLYEYLGDLELATHYNELSDRHRMRNPYYRYHLAHNAFLNEEYETAISHLKYSVRKKKNEDAFYFLMGLSYLMEGEESAARRWLEEAEQVADDENQKRNYHNKVERLLGSR